MGSKYFEGVVLKARHMSKTIMVGVWRVKENPRVHKLQHLMKKYMTHDPDEICDVGDRVMLAQSRRFSKRKNWIVDHIIHKNPAAQFLRDNPQYLATQDKLPRSQQVKLPTTGAQAKTVAATGTDASAANSSSRSA
eukprot:TRINITY_DN1298_c1_g1_i5.p2 TRINITY_DN1298_c1_g1~~TRINITY_DN1298_c1_g1_i5.p2  ORF type:complete len:148 (-),score=39.00 TRINITY_DN1298_c1_g1_i5:259-666(-)